MPEETSAWKTGDLAFPANGKTCTKSPWHEWMEKFSGVRMKELREVD